MKNAKSKTTTVLAKTLCYSDQTVGRLICPTAARHDGLEAKLPGVTDVHAEILKHIEIFLYTCTHMESGQSVVSDIVVVRPSLFLPFPPQFKKKKVSTLNSGRKVPPRPAVLISQPSFLTV